MPRKSQEDRVVHKTAAEVPAASATDLARLHEAMGGRIDTSDIPERRGAFSRLKRDAGGNLPKKGLIREAIVRQLERRRMTRYRLWAEAKVHCPTLSQAAVYEFIDGKRQLELPYAEALMAAVGLRVVGGGAPKRGKKGAVR